MNDLSSATDLINEAAKTAAQLSVDASVAAKEVIATAAEVASHTERAREEDSNRIQQALEDALNKVFGEKEEQRQFININRVPMICVQIQEIHKNINTITIAISELQLVKRIVYAVCGLVGVSVVGALLALILRK